MRVFVAPFKRDDDGWCPPSDCSCLADTRAPNGDQSASAIFKGHTLPVGATEIKGETALKNAILSAFVTNADPAGVTGPYPLSLTRNGVLGYAWPDGSIRGRKFAGVSDVHWKKLQAHLRHQYRKRWLKNQTHARQWMSVQMRKTRLIEERAFIPGDLPVVKPIRPTTYVSDDFNRANENLEAGSWSLPNDVSGGGDSFAVVSNQCAIDNGGTALMSAIHDTDMSSDDHSVSLDALSLATPGLGVNSIGVIIRDEDDGATTTNRFAIQLSLASAGSWVLRIQRRGSSPSFLASTSQSVSLPDRFTGDCNGSTIRSLLNGSLVDSVTDSNFSGNVAVGIEMRDRSGANDAVSDNWVATDLFHMPLMVNHYNKMRRAG